MPPAQDLGCGLLQLALTAQEVDDPFARVRATPTGVNERWSMDLVTDSLFNGRRFRALTIVDGFSRESPAIEVDFSLTGERVFVSWSDWRPSVGCRG